MANCQHEHVEDYDLPYFNPIAIDLVDGEPNPAAHGNICVTECCRDCGLIRKTNVNGFHRETSIWYDSVSL